MAAFDFTERRQVPLAALGKATPIVAVRERGRDALASRPAIGGRRDLAIFAAVKDD